MGRPSYQLVEVKSAVNRVDNMPFRWSLNPYRGCVHDCAYCYARTTHHYFDLGVDEFAGVIYVKTNLASVLRSELRRRSWRHESICIGTATDPYQPAEGEYRITRACLEVLADAANPCSITTKGTLFVRDLDLMQELARVTDFVVHVTLVTLDRDLWRRLEPGAPPPVSRLRALDRVRAAGIPASVYVAPILPGLTDHPDQLRALIQAAADHGATGVWPGVLRLAPGVKEWFLAFLRREFPRLAAAYERGYQSGTVPPFQYRRGLDQRFDRIVSDVRFIPPGRGSVRQMVGKQYLLPM